MGETVVSVIMAVYNAGEYLAQALDSTQRQGLAGDQIEVIAVDDGSTDGSGELLDGYAARFPSIRVLHQANSGGPGAPRNAGLDVARGRYVFFMDADDELTDGALRDMTAVADREGSDVVLGQVRGIDGRSARGATFPSTRLHVDLLEDNVFRTLGPWKLFRRELIEQHAMRFRTDVKVAEDQLLVARAYLTASTISILADRDYYLLRQRADGGNVTRTVRGPAELVDAFTHLTEVVLEETEPGRLRDAVMWRAVTWSLGKPLDARFLKGTEADQRYVVERIQQVLGPVWSPALAVHQKDILRTKTEIALSGDVDTLRRFIAWEIAATRSSRLLRLDSEGVSLDLPADLAAHIDTQRLHAPAPKGRAELREWSVQGDTVHVQMDVLVGDSSTPAPEVVLSARCRESGERLEYPVDRSRAITSPEGAGSRIEVALPTHDLAVGVWDLWIIQRAGDEDIATRLGGRRQEGVPTSTAELVDPEGTPHGVVYFTKKAKNLSLDIGFRLHPSAGPLGTVVALLSDQGEESAIAVVTLHRPVPARGEIRDAQGRRLRELEARQSSASVLSLWLPLTLVAAGETLHLALTNDAGTGAVELASDLDTRALQGRTLRGAVGTGSGAEEPQDAVAGRSEVLRGTLPGGSNAQEAPGARGTGRLRRALQRARQGPADR
ncbi:glycosyltransferase [Brachybacterium halotolerans subsp. kimchii]|uniref:glycosyltransferase family 2 protein n=1 Tax=Brachybacterium halotolerans TaxID=2795215 RepID=UPI001E381DF7|nr:glycosyltransferase family 2 protein [Brachybacterium halotolerans]UEJ84154.1 glycosyltransferase [Brachybacterium halotolerans subsp. kimchii]